MLGQLEGQQIGRYLIRQRLGGGGVATVYQAYDQVMGQTVALKILPPNPDQATLDRFRREALMAGALRHPHIVRILQVGNAANGNSAYIAMDLVEGESLAALLARFGQLRPEESCLLLEPIARALAFAHRHGVVHRDVKPSNILLRPVGLPSAAAGDAQGVRLDVIDHPIAPLLSDFGIARFMDAPELTNAGRTVGTPAFMAPEQCMGSREVDGRADIYSLGVVLYRCVVGRLPFHGSATQILHAQVYEPVVLDELVARQLPPLVVEILRRSLAKAPEDRYPVADELANQLATVVRDAGKLSDSSPAYAATRTATMTLSQAHLVTDAVASDAPSAVQVLVPGVVGAGEKPALGRISQVRKRWPSWQRMMWAALLFLLLGGGVVLGIDQWRSSSRREAGQVALLPATTPATLTPLALNSALEGNSAPVGNGVTPTITLASTAVLPLVRPTVMRAAATILPTATPLPLPTSTFAPLPTIAATPAPLVVLPTPTLAMPTLTATVVITPGELVAGTCPMVVDEFFLATVANMMGELAGDFACPAKPADVVEAAWMPFAQGVMVAVNNSLPIYVYYSTTGEWEQVISLDSIAAQPDALPSEDEQGVPPPEPFERVWMTDGRRLLLGPPLQVTAQQASTVVQPFNGGVLLGNRGDGRVLPLARSKLRF